MQPLPAGGGLIQVLGPMGAFENSAACLRFFGDDLVPDQFSMLLGASPTTSQVKGQELVGRVTGRVRIAKTGSWLREAARREPEDLDAQVFEILDALTQDLAIWQTLASRYKPDLYCGMFMAGSNDGFGLSAAALHALGQRGISLVFDVYDASDGEPSGGP